MEELKMAVIGTDGKVGMRTNNNLVKGPDLFDLRLAENSPTGIESIRARGLDVTSVEEAFAKAEVIVFAMSDTLIKKLSEVYVPMIRPGTSLLILNPAAAVAKELILRDDYTFGMAHSYHPSYFLNQDTYEVHQDRLGGCDGKQDIAMSKIQGDDTHFARLVGVARNICAPILHAYVVTSEQIVSLEPTLVELPGATYLYTTVETVDKTEEKGIGCDATVSFLADHVYDLTTSLLGLLSGKPPVSDAYRVAIGLGNCLVLHDDWKKIWDGEVLDRMIVTILHPRGPQIQTNHSPSLSNLLAGERQFLPLP